MLISWFECAENANIRTFNYWNDEAQERLKVFNVANSDFEKLDKSRHLNEIKDQLIELNRFNQINFNNKYILSLCAGTCWLESWLINEYKNIKHITAVDFSHHRIHKLAPLTLEHYKIPKSKMTLIWGDILDLKIESNSQDIVLLSQAFHHIDQPKHLLREIKRVLKRDGRVVIIGEHFFGNKIYLKRFIKHFAKYILNYKKYRTLHSFIPSWNDLFPPSLEKGDIHYSRNEYNTIFFRSGFGWKRFVNKTAMLQAYVLRISE